MKGKSNLPKRFLSGALSLFLMSSALGYFPDGTFESVFTLNASADEGTTPTTSTAVTFTAVAGSPKGNADEGYANLFDGNTATKWCCDSFSSCYVILKASEPIKVAGYKIATANDTATNTGRNPKAWTLSGAMSYDTVDTTTWTEIDSVSDGAMPTANQTYKTYTLDAETTSYYQYFKFNISSTVSASIMQISELALLYNESSLCTHDWVNTDQTIPPTCTDGGYNVQTCSICGGTRNAANGVPATGHSYTNGICSNCHSDYQPATLITEANYETYGFTENNSYVGYYAIEKAGDLYWFAGLINGTLNDTKQNAFAKAVLVDNIIVNQTLYDNEGALQSDLLEWTPIGTDTTVFRGTFDGQEHTISGLYFNDSTKSYIGLFGYAQAATIQNVGVVNSYLNASNRVGGVCGYSYNSTIANCYNTATVLGLYTVGGVCGYHDSGTIKNCYNTGTVSASEISSYVGGVCGGNSSSAITNCYNTGTVSASGNDASVGGVCGYYYNSSTVNSISKCYNTGTIKASGNSASIGGVCGNGSASTKNVILITDCYNTGTITHSGTATNASYKAGGVCGRNYSGIVKNCYTTGAISETGSSTYVGAVCGYTTNSSTTSNCYYSADYSGSSVGYNQGTVDTNVVGKTVAEFASGEVAYLLQKSRSTQIWGQNIDNESTVQSYPVFSDAKVYKNVTYGDTCKDKTVSYSNTKVASQAPHRCKDGVCTVCGANEPPVEITAGNYSTYGFTADNYADYLGYYALENANDLYWFAGLVNGTLDDTERNASANAVLVDDITVNKDLLDSFQYDEDESITNLDDFTAWPPIGYYSNIDREYYYYLGVFDGLNHTISGLLTNGIDHVGLFGLIGENAKIKNVGVVDSYFYGEYFVGGVCGYNFGGSITNCYNMGYVIGSGDIGGVCGLNESGMITNCYNAGYVWGAEYSGGICGSNDTGGTITDCYNTGAVNGLYRTGGVCGYNNDTDSRITNCYNTGSVTMENGDGNTIAGGVCGLNGSGMITNCYNTGAVTASSTDDISAGGVCGYNDEGLIANCYSAGAVTASSTADALAGGVCGYNDWGMIKDCYYDSTLYTGSAIGYGAGDSMVVEARTSAQFASGEVAYLLQGDQTKQIWGQNIDNESTVQSYPVFSDAKVYENVTYTTCHDKTVAYSNTNADNVYVSHHYENGHCTVCGAFELSLKEPKQISAENYEDYGFTADNYEDYLGYYAIENASQLYWFAGLVNGTLENVLQNPAANAVLTDDITVNANLLKSLAYDENGKVTNGDAFTEWFPIGYYYYDYDIDSATSFEKEVYYTGTFDGLNHTISGLYYKDGDLLYCVGLFGQIKNAIIQNVGIKDSYFKAYSDVGAVCGYTEESIIANCYNTGTVIGSSYVGGVCGYGDYAKITDCYNTGTVIGSEDVGGVCGFNSAEITDCYNTGAISVSASANEYVSVGGVCGYSSAEITDCYNTGAISVSASDSGGLEVGGVCGVSSDAIIDCYNTGTISVSASARDGMDVGGVCGYIYRYRLANCYNTGTISVSGVGDYVEIGGVCGYSNSSTITNCYNIAAVSVGASASEGMYVGGVCAYNKGRMINCYNTGATSVASPDAEQAYYTGDLCGYNSEGTIYNCYYSSGKFPVGCDDNGTCGDNVLEKTTTQFASGDVAYLLAQGCTVSNVTYDGSVWGQTIGKDKTPVLNGSKVYTYTDCQENTSYANSEITSGDHNYVNGRCFVCGDLENGTDAHLAGYSLSLSGDIGVNFYMVLSDDVIADKGAYMLFTLPDGTTSKVYVKDVQTDSTTTEGTTYYIFSCEVAAKEMYETIKAQIVLSNEDTCREYSFTIEDYADYILDAHNGFDSKTVALVKAMLGYGDYAKAYFNDQELAATSEIEAVTAKALADYAIATSGTLPAGIKYYGSTLILESETTIRHYFKVAEGTDISAYNMTAKDGSDGFYYVQISNITADALGTAQITTIGDFSISYSALSYAYAALNSDSASDSLQNLVKALTLYEKAATAYLILDEDAA